MRSASRNFARIVIFPAFILVSALFAPLPSIAAEPPTQDATLTLKCWEALQNSEGQWTMGDEKSDDQISAAFGGASGQTVCWNFTHTGGSLGEIFVGTGMYCKCEASALPVPPQSPRQQGDFSNISLVLNSHPLAGRIAGRIGVEVYGVGLSILDPGVQKPANTNLNVVYKLVLTSLKNSASGKAALKACKSLALKALLHKQLNLRVSARKVTVSKRAWYNLVSVDLSDFDGAGCELVRR